MRHLPCLRSLCGPALAAALLALAATAVAEAASGDAAVAVATHLEATQQGARLVFDLSRSIDVKTTVLENPDRIVVDMPPVNFQIDAAAGRAAPGSGLVKAYRFGTYTADRSRIVIDLAAPADVRAAAATPIAGRDAARLVIQIARTDRAAFHKAAQQGSPASVPGPVAAASSQDDGAKPVVVIDPGHGGIDPGASGLGGVVEKTITSAFAEALAARLRNEGRYAVLLTRTGDTFVSLADRVRITRAAKAALFISIHADTVAEGDGVSGATVYTAADRASDSEAARVAASENKVDGEAGVEVRPDANDVNDILLDLTRRETRTFSHSFQRTLAGYWQKIARLNKNPERSAGFWVLKAPDVPSVLLELGYLSNADDVAALTSPAWRDKAAGTIAASIDSFFAARGKAGNALAQAAAGDPDTSAIVTLRPHL